MKLGGHLMLVVRGCLTRAPLVELSHVGGGSVVLEVAPDEVTRRQGRHQTQLARQHRGAHHPGQLGSVLARVSGVRTLDPQHLQAGGLGGQDGAAAHCAHLYARHGAGNVEVLAPLPPGLHQRDAVGAAHCLRRVLAGGDVDRCYDVRGVSVKALKYQS